MKFQYFKTFLTKFSIFAYISLKIGYFALGDDYDDTVTSYFGCWYYFGIYGKKRSLAILWYQLDVSESLISSSQVVVTTPFERLVRKKLGKTRVNIN